MVKIGPVFREIFIFYSWDCISKGIIGGNASECPRWLSNMLLVLCVQFRKLIKWGAMKLHSNFLWFHARFYEKVHSDVSYIDPNVSYTDPCVGYNGPCVSYIDPCVSYIDLGASYIDPCVSYIGPCVSYIDLGVGYDQCRLNWPWCKLHWPGHRLH